MVIVRTSLRAMMQKMPKKCAKNTEKPKTAFFKNKVRPPVFRWGATSDKTQKC